MFVHWNLDNAAPARYVWDAGGNGLTPSSERGPSMSMSEDGPGGARPIPAASQRGLRRRARGPAMPGAGLRSRVLQAVRADPDVVLFAARVSVWTRWFVWLVAVVEMAYRPGFWYPANRGACF